MLHIHFSNRFEQLAAQLLERLAVSPAGPFDADTVVVPSAAVQRALTLVAADTLGVCSQLRFTYLAPWLWAQMARVLPGVAARSPFAPALLRWRVYAALGEAGWVHGHPRLQAYLGQADEVMRFELASRVAGLFDQYLTYRPDWLQAWQQAVQRPAPFHAAWADASPAQQADAAWQAALWRHLAADSEQAQRATGTAFVDALHLLQPAPAHPPGLPAQAQPQGLPAQVHVFALPTMPAVHMHWLQQLARLMQVHVYVLNPCQEYWFELIAPRRLSHLAARGQAAAAAHHEVGHRLLAGWGRQTQAMIDGLVDSMDGAGEGLLLDEAHFQPLPGSSLLARLHNSVLNLHEPEPGAWLLAPDDRSVEVHVCHSLTRELEVLHDHLLGLLARGEWQHPSQVLVVTPDLEAAAPLIDAVFGTAPPQRALPYTLTGRARSRVNAPARALLAVLALAGSRFQAPEVFAVLQQDIVARRFGLDASALQQLHHALLATGVRWGLDAPHRASLHLPATAAQTWADALDRLFLGHALPAQVPQPFGDQLPAGDTEGQAALALGALAQFIARLQALHQAVAAPRPPRAWQALLLHTVDQFLQPLDDELDDQGELLVAVAELFDDLQSAGAGPQAAAVVAEMAGGGAGSGTGSSEAAATGPPADPGDAAPLPFAVLHAALKMQLDDPARGGVPTGGITFSSMSSLRSLPYEHICIIGLNDGAYPSSQSAPEFDLMPLQPRRGDRQRRHDERNLFLDLLLAARRSVYISYVGRSVRDNAPLPPSVLVSELLDWLLPAVATGADGLPTPSERARLVVEHPLQAFDASGFTPEADPRVRSFNAELAAALRSSLQAQAAMAMALPPLDLGEPDDGLEEGTPDGTPDASAFDEDRPDDTATMGSLPSFFNAPLPVPEPAWRSLSLQQLDEFLRNPCRSLLRRRLGLALDRDTPALEDEEAFLPDTRGRRALAARLLPALLAGADAASVQALARAGHELPPGALGEEALKQELQALTDFSGEVLAHTEAPLLPAFNLQLQWTLEGESWQLAAPLNALRAQGQLRWRYDPLRATDRLSAWLAHLALCASAAPGAAPHTLCLSLDAPLQLPPVPQAQAVALLGELVALVRSGLRQPLHFFPRSAWAYVEKDGDLAAAQAAWQVSTHSPHGESADPAYRLALRGCAQALDTRFEALAWQVFGPLKQALDGAEHPPGAGAPPVATADGVAAA